MGQGNTAEYPDESQQEFLRQLLVRIKENRTRWLDLTTDDVATFNSLDPWNPEPYRRDLRAPAPPNTAYYRLAFPRGETMWLVVESGKITLYRG
jgi:hypothetical protein